MESNGKLDIRINKRRNLQRNSFVPTESEASNQFANSHFTQSEQQSPNNKPVQPSPQVIKRNQAQEPKEHLNMQNANKKQINHNHHLHIIQEDKKQQQKNKPEKRRNNFNSFELSDPEPQKKVSPALKQPIHNKNQDLIKSKQASIQQKKLSEISKNIQKLNSSINDLRDNYDDLEKKQREMTERRKPKKLQRNLSQQRDMNPFGVKMSQQKERQIKQFLTIKQQQERTRRKKLDDYNQREQHKLQLQYREQQMLKQRQRKRRLKQLKKYSKFDEKHQKWQQQEEQRKIIAQELMKKHEGQVKFHIRKEMEDKQKEMIRLKKERQILQQRKDYFKSVDPTEIEQHQKWYEDKLYQLTRQKQDAKEEQAQRIAEENSNFNELWRGQSHGFVQEEINQKKKKKRQPKQRARRIKQYKNYIKKHFVPKTYQSKTVQPKQIDQSRYSHRQVKRYRFFKGVAYGQVVEKQPKSKDHSQQNKLGDNYLQFMKSLPKKRQTTPQQQFRLDPQEIEILQRKFNHIGRAKKQVHPMYDDNYRKKTSIEVPKNVRRDQLKMIMLQLKAHDEKLKQKQVLLNYQQHGKVQNVQGQQKSINQGLVENIERKLSLLAQI